MKVQSAIEFLSTYGFLFLVLAVVIAALFVLASSASVSVPAQCSGFGGFTCSYSSYYSNITNDYSLATMVLSNSQGVPLNVSNFSITVGSTTINGLCTPTFVYPGADSVCMSVFNSITSPGVFVRGSYLVGSKYCGGGVGALPSGNCTVPVIYTGAFQAQATSYQTVAFGVDIATGANGIAMPSYSSLKPMYLPANFVIAESGDWDVNGTAGNVLYSFGTANYVGTVYLGSNTLSFPPSTSTLDSAAACGSSNAPTLSMAYTTVYVPVSENLEKIETANAMALYYRTSNTLTAWSSIFGSATWATTGLTAYSSNTVISKGLYSLDSVWYTPCGQDVQALNVS